MTKGKDEAPTIEFAVAVRKNGEIQWESKMAAPLFASEERQKATGEAWCELMLAGLNMGRLLRDEEPK